MTSNSDRISRLERMIEAQNRTIEAQNDRLVKTEEKLKKIVIDLNTFKFDIGYRQGLHYARERKPEVRKAAYSRCTSAFEGDVNYAKLCGVAHAHGKFPRPGGTVDRLASDHLRHRRGESGASTKLQKGRSDMAARAKRLNMRLPLKVKSKKRQLSFEEMQRQWTDCSRKLKESMMKYKARERALKWETVNFKFACREYSKVARDCVIAEYNRERPAHLANLTARGFADPLKKGLDTDRLRSSFERVGVPPRLVTFIRESIADGDSIAHRFNTKNHTELDVLLAGLRRVDAPSKTKESFRELAKLWKKGLCRAPGVGHFRD